MELFADEDETGSENQARPRPLRVLKRRGDRPGEVGGRPETPRRVSGGTDESLEQRDEPLVVMKKRGQYTPGHGLNEFDVTDRGTTERDAADRECKDRDSICSYGIAKEKVALSSYDGNSVTGQPLVNPPMSDPFSDPMPIQDAAILVPRIVVTPAVRALESSRGSMWVAIEVLAELSRPPNGTLDVRRPVSSGASSVSGDDHHQVGDRYGCIYDMNIQLIPLGNNCILETIQEDEPTPTMILLGLKVLVLAHIHFEPQSRVPFKAKGHMRQISDELIDDLETQLGSSTAEYLRIVVTYKHSAFPKHGNSDTVDGVADVGTKLETSAIAVIQQLNHRSPWSLCPTPAQNPLFGIIHQHWPWESKKGREVIQRIVRQRTTPEKPAKLAFKLLTDDSPMTMRTPPVVPRRETSLGKDATVQQPKATQPGWSELRRTSATTWRKSRADSYPRVPSSTTYPDDLEPGDKDPRPAGILRSPRSMGAGLLRGLGASTSDASATSSTTERRSLAGSIRGRAKKTGRWAWGWW